MSLRAVPFWVAASLLSYPAGATDGLPVAFLRDARRADVVVLGRVLEAVPTWTGRWVETETLIRVDAALGGPGDRTVRVRTIGGEVNGIGTWVPGAARFVVGADVAVLLARTDAGLVPISGADSVIVLDASEGPAREDVLRSVSWMRDWSETWGSFVDAQ